ncbi:Aldo keto reductase [Crassisporium funariophilum]|nr:Aldo keto reductase [Crassisporium funariophilum]
MSLSTRKIGNVNVSEIGLGLMGLSAFYGDIGSDEERFKLLDAAVEEGATYWDSADIYGDSEDLVGKWFKRTGKRDKIFLATKFGITATGVNGKPEYVQSAAERSLKRLGVDTIDLYYVHRIDKTVPIENTIAALAELVKQGKVRYLGLSEASEATIRRAHAVHPISAVQVEYSPFSLEIEDQGILKACQELGIAVVAYAPLGRGMLTGAYKSPDDFPEGDFRRSVPNFSKENFPNVLKLVENLQQLGQKHNATAGQVTLAWLLAQSPNVIPIPGTKKIKYLKENVGAANIKLSTEEVAEIRKLVNQANPGTLGRYAPEHSTNLLGDTVAL